jgi:protein-S-isoprenylcysteine O-methyltransferase Ste14
MLSLGTNWSNTLELREEHRLITGGIYHQIRHPIYAALLLYRVGQALVVSTWVVGLSFLVPFGILARVAAQMAEPDRAIGALQKLLSMPGGSVLAENVPLTLAPAPT